MDFTNINLILIALSTFSAVCIIFISLIRTMKLKKDEGTINQRLSFWLSEKTAMQRLMGEGGNVGESREKNFMDRVLKPLGEQVGNWMSDKIPYSSKKSKRLQLIRAGIRGKNSLELFYSIKLALAALLGVLFFICFSMKDFNRAILLSMVLGGLGYIIPNYYLDKKAESRRQCIDQALPDALDLLVICTEAGMGIDQALLRVAANLGKVGKELQSEIILTNREMNLGQDRTICWKNLAERTTSKELKNLVGAVMQSEKVGAQIAKVLRDQSDFMRVRRRQKAEESAAQMTVKMLIPMVIFIFPCIMAICLGPPVLMIMATFSKM